jgi:hypothetical protein
MNAIVRPSVITLGIVALAIGVPSQIRAQAPSCEPVGQIRFVCGQDGPEDLVAVPNSAWLIASAYGASGGLFAINTKEATSTRLFPSPTATDRIDRETYASCPGPLQGEDRERFRTHGLYLKETRRGVHTLYVVHHGERESVELFELDTRSTPMGIAWIGCVVAPDPIGLNAVVALPDGGLAATNFDPRPPRGGRGGFSTALTAGERNGEVWEWHPKTGWSKVPGSEASGANGIEISPDGQWYYIAEWGNRAFMRLSRGRMPPERQEIPLGFRVDNVRWDRDGLLLVAGQGEPGGVVAQGGGAGNLTMSIIGRINPQTMTYTAIITQPTNERLAAATVAIEVDGELWAGSFRGDRIARYPFPRPGRRPAAK